MDALSQIKSVHAKAPALARVSDDARAGTLRALAKALEAATPAILAENEKDLAEMPKDDPRYERLLLTPARIKSIAEDTAKVADLPSPVGLTLSEKTMPNGLHIKKTTVPLGVVGVIYESRPNVTVDVFALCFKAGNASVLKGGKEARHTNAAFMKTIHDTLKQNGVDPGITALLPADRDAAGVLLNATGLIDVCIPRGSERLIAFVRDTAKVPVIETGAGIVHTYIDESADATKAADIVNNAKTRRVSVCNALDTLVIHRARLADLGHICAPLVKSAVEIFADKAAFAILEKTYPKNLLHAATPEDFGREFLSYKMSVKTVDSLDNAIAHIRAHSSRHSEAIVAEDPAAIEKFLNAVDAAAVYANASTAFTDGGQFGMGAEIGISTQKLHARGPMGLDALTSYKWIVTGSGQIRA